MRTGFLGAGVQRAGFLGTGSIRYTFLTSEI